MAIVRGMLFDLDDTLTDRGRSIELFVPAFAEHFGGELEGVGKEEILQSILGGDGGGYATREALAEHLRQILRWKKVPSVGEITTFWRGRFPGCAVAREGTVRTLRAIRDRGILLGVVSNGLVLSQYTKLEVMGIRPLLAAVVISEEVGIKKPDRRIFDVALERLGVSAAEAVFMGDNPLLDVAGAAAVGMRAIWLNCRKQERPAGMPACVEIADITEVMRHLGD
jgi:putative hydrolase of the HAD superfamily